MNRMYDYSYLNPVKVESLFAQLNGHVINERKERTEKGVKGVGKLGVEIGSTLAKLGLAKGTAEGKLSSDYSKILEITTTLSLENKLNVVQTYNDNYHRIARVDLSSVDYSELSSSIRASDFQILRGVFRLHIDDLAPDAVGEALIEAFHFVAGRYYREMPENVELRYKNGELLSERRHSDTNEPLVRVPLFFEHLLPNQLFLGSGARNQGLSISVLGNCIVEPAYIVANPVAIWLEY